MSAISKQQDDGTEGLEWAARHRDELEREANSDLPHAWMAARILQRLEEEEEDDDESDVEAGGS
mgnify:CR=1 FL=1